MINKICFFNYIVSANKNTKSSKIKFFIINDNTIIFTTINCLSKLNIFIWFNIEPYEDIQLAQAIYSGKNNGIVINNKKFDFARFSILIGAHDVIKETYFVDQEFMDLIARYSFLYQLNEEEMKDAVIRSCDENKNVLTSC